MQGLLENYPFFQKIEPENQINMDKQLFIEAIEAIKQQCELDTEVSKHLGKAFPHAFEANLLPDNHYLQNALLHVLQVEMNDIQIS